MVPDVQRARAALGARAAVHPVLAAGAGHAAATIAGQTAAARHAKRIQTTTESATVATYCHFCVKTKDILN